MNDQPFPACRSPHIPMLRPDRHGARVHAFGHGLSHRLPAAAAWCHAGARLLLAAPLALALLAVAPQAMAQQRNLQQLIGPTVADQVSNDYRFERFVVSSADGSRQWRVNLAIPRAPAPAQGRAGFWMLDGNAALQEFSQPLLQALAQADAPVLVFIGHDNEQRVDSLARTYDYTPVPELPDAQTGQARGGGAGQLLATIEGRIHAEVSQRVALDATRQVLWGHSLGGLFTLHALYAHSRVFTTYAAASPSLWWREGAVLGEPERQFMAAPPAQPRRLLLMLGGSERERDFSGRDLDNPRVRAHLQRVTVTPADAVAQLAQRLRAVPGLQVEYREFPGLGHGPMLRASLLYALHATQSIADYSATPRS